MQGLKLSDVGINANRIILLEIRKKVFKLPLLFKLDIIWKYGNYLFECFRN